MIANSARKPNTALSPQPSIHQLLLLALLLPLALRASGQTSGTATLAWNPSPGPGVAGYRLYQGTASRTSSSTTNPGNVTNTTVSGLTSGLTYFFAVTALGTNGLESQFSNEINYT